MTAVQSGIFAKLEFITGESVELYWHEAFESVAPLLADRVIFIPLIFVVPLFFICRVKFFDAASFKSREYDAESKLRARFGACRI